MPATLPPPRSSSAPKRSTLRISAHERRLAILAGDNPIDRTEEQLELFQRLFACRYTYGIVTKLGQGPRAWTKLRGTLTEDRLIDHLLADAHPSGEPRWYGARSFRESNWFAIDVDADKG